MPGGVILDTCKNDFAQFVCKQDVLTVSNAVSCVNQGKLQAKAVMLEFVLNFGPVQGF